MRDCNHEIDNELCALVLLFPNDVCLRSAKGSDHTGFSSLTLSDPIHLITDLEPNKIVHSHADVGSSSASVCDMFTPNGSEWEQPSHTHIVWHVWQDCKCAERCTISPKQLIKRFYTYIQECPNYAIYGGIWWCQGSPACA